MSLTSFTLYAFLLCIVGPILLAARVLYSKQKKRIIRDYWKSQKLLAFGFLLGAFCSVIADLWRGDDLYNTFDHALGSFIVLLIIPPLAYVLILYVERRASRKNSRIVLER